MQRALELRARDVRSLRAAAAAAEAVIVGGDDARRVTVRISGPPKYVLETRARRDEKAAAERLFDDAESAARAVLEAAETAFGAAAEGAAADGAAADAAAECADAGGIGPQPTLNVGLIGDVAHGKSTLCKALTGKTTQQHSLEQRAHGATIKLGFANCALWRCTDGACAAPGCYRATAGDAPAPAACPACGEGPMELVRRVSLVDCPGHAELMATMLTGAASFDAALLVAAANTPCPAPQAAAHVAALDAAGAGGCGGGGAGAGGALVAHATAAERFGARTDAAASAPVLPVCAPLGAGLDAVACFLATVAGGDSGRGRAERRAAPARFRVLRSFDVSQTGGEAATGALRGGVVGGSLERGALAVGDALEVRPGAWRKPPGEESAEGTVALAGRSNKKKDGKKKGSGVEVVAWRCTPLRTVVEGIKSDAVDLAAAAPGGLVALRTRLDPAVTRDDALVGAVAGAP